jgi:hypothetical protein
MTPILRISGALLFAFPLLPANDPPEPLVLDDGTAKYAALKAGLDPLTRFVQQIEAVSPESHPALFPSRAHKLAYWLNTYNALVLRAVAKEYPPKKDRLSGLIGR